MIQVVNRALDILKILAQNSNKKYTLGEIAGSLDLNHGTCANIIKTMVNRGFIENYGKKQGYSLGPEAYHLTDNFPYKKELLVIASEPVKNLGLTLNESCILASLRNNKRITLYQVTDTHELQVNTPQEKNAYLTATGRVILAFKSSDEQEKYIQEYGLPEEMWPEVKNNHDLTIEFNNIKEKRLAIHHAESDVVGVAAPIVINDKVLASLGVYLPESRFKYKFQQLIFTELEKTAKYINEELRNI